MILRFARGWEDVPNVDTVLIRKNLSSHDRMFNLLLLSLHNV